MKGFKLSLFLFITWWSIVSASVEDNSGIELQIIHQENTVKENNLNANKHVINIINNTVNYNQDYFYTEDLKKICHNQVNEFIWKCPTISDSEEKVLKFRTINDRIGFQFSSWYLKSINEIDIFEIDSNPDRHQIQFYVKIYKKTISLGTLYPTYPDISGFEILQFISNLALQCKFSIDVFDGSDISTVYSALYGKSYYEYHFEGINLSQNFLFKKIVVKKKTFLDCFEGKIRSPVYEEPVSLFGNLPQLYYKNIQACENAFLSVEFCPITFDTHRFFYEKSFQYCIDWSPLRGFPGITLPSSQLFEITPENLTRIMKKKKQPDANFVKINRDLDEKVLKTYDEIKTQIFDTSFLMKLFSNIFELCFIELEKRKPDPNPEDILKLYLRPCVIPNINLFLKYHADI